MLRLHEYLLLSRLNALFVCFSVRMFLIPYSFLSQSSVLDIFQSGNISLKTWYPDGTHYSKCGSPANLWSAFEHQMKSPSRHTTLLVMLNFLSIIFSAAGKFIPSSIEGQMVFECERVTLYWSIYISLAKRFGLFFQAVKSVWNSTSGFMMSWTNMINIKPMSSSKFLITRQG